VLSGTAEAGSTVTVSRSTLGVLGTAIANGSGAWSFDYAGTTLADGTRPSPPRRRMLRARQRGVCDFTVTVDTVCPRSAVFSGISATPAASATDSDHQRHDV